MPLEASTPEAPGHKATIDSTTPGRAHAVSVTCSCGETLFTAEELSYANAIAAFEATTAHMRAHGWRDARDN